MKKIHGLIAVLILLCCLGTAGATPAQDQEIREAWKAAEGVAQHGAAEVMLLDQGRLTLPAGYAYIPQPQAGQLMKAMGNRENPALIGMVVGETGNWIVLIKYQKAGYIKDDDAKNWNVEELFASIKEGTEEANKERRERGFSELEIIGWVERPQYNEEKRQLIWSISARDKNSGAAEDARQIINYNTYVLGREGYLTLTLLTSMGKINQDKPAVLSLLGATQFIDGKRYEDFNASTDKIAEYGLATLVAGAAAKKLGFFAVVGGFLAKFAKVIGLAVLALGGLVTKLFRRRGDGQ